MPRTAKQYKLVPAEIPPRRGRGVGVKVVSRDGRAYLQRL
jgi:hypothetical protein